ncbi:hypothetical protein [Bradyrhizobium sp. AS23.2]|uniref:hypothetical protein n=1 Tax=Bradyrhizobium sp. AS23.2 TaxID=1680155 RepID=UPI00093D5203|nr:hypothetical protein [Bradyrhizobium sp. AS23.2]OKO86819.1 hypothetical protein AC630_01870 [Bradyrhizobium sp. AS23.2]
MAQVPNWRTKLIENYPNLLHPPEGQPEAAASYISCEEGWHDLLARLCVRMQAALQRGETIRILQIKKKSATLRVYWRGDVTPLTIARIHEATAVAEARSACTCEVCGTEGEPYNLGGACITRCATHARGELVPAPPGPENVHLVRVATPGRDRVVARRYDREADRFADEDPTGLESKRRETIVTENWRVDLMLTHPRLFEIVQDDPKSSFGYPNCAEEWRDALEELCISIETALGQNETFKYFKITQRLGVPWIEWDGEVSGDTVAKIDEASRLFGAFVLRSSRLDGREKPLR